MHPSDCNQVDALREADVLDAAASYIEIRREWAKGCCEECLQRNEQYAEAVRAAASRLRTPRVPPSAALPADALWDDLATLIDEYGNERFQSVHSMDREASMTRAAIDTKIAQIRATLQSPAAHGDDHRGVSMEMRPNEARVIADALVAAVTPTQITIDDVHKLVGHAMMERAVRRYDMASYFMGLAERMARYALRDIAAADRIAEMRAAQVASAAQGRDEVST